MKVLVTGAAGFIGKYVVQALMDQGFIAVAADNLSKGKREQIPTNIPFYQIDITQSELETVFNEERPDYVIHLAAQSSVMDSIADPMTDCETNIVGTLNVLKYSQKYKIKKCVFASSAAVYGNPSSLPVKEEAMLTPLSFYALSKLSAEKYIQLYETMFGVKSCILRFSNVFGPLQAGGVITNILNRIYNDENPIIYNGDQTRDFIYVKDVANSCIQAIKTDMTGIFNISSASEISIKEVYEKLSEMVPLDLEPTYEPAREGEIERSVLSNTKAISTLEWTPVYSLADGLKETVDYYAAIN